MWCLWSNHWAKPSFFEANTSSTSHEIPRILWKIMCRYRVHNSMPLSPILSQINAYRILPPTFLRHILITSSHLTLGLPSSLLPSVSSPKPCRRSPSLPYFPHTLHIAFSIISCANTIVLRPPWWHCEHWSFLWGTCLVEVVFTSTTTFCNVVRKENVRQTASLAVFSLQ